MEPENGLGAFEYKAKIEHHILPGRVFELKNDKDQSYKFVRADRFSSKEDVVSYALAKGRQIIDEQGEGIYRP